jgi:hypothetical protein
LSIFWASVSRIFFICVISSSFSKEEMDNILVSVNYCSKLNSFGWLDLIKTQNKSTENLILWNPCFSCLVETLEFLVVLSCH